MLRPLHSFDLLHGVWEGCLSLQENSLAPLHLLTFLDGRENITLRNIFINSPERSPGVIMGNASNPIRNLTFDNVVVTNPGSEPWGEKFYYCDGVEGTSEGDTWPVPPCFKVVEGGEEEEEEEEEEELSSDTDMIADDAWMFRGSSK